MAVCQNLNFDTPPFFINRKWVLAACQCPLPILCLPKKFIGRNAYWRAGAVISPLAVWNISFAVLGRVPLKGKSTSIVCTPLSSNWK